MTLLSDLQYFPSVILFKIIDKSSNIVFEQYEFYQKMSFRNRCTVAGAQGPIQLSIPLKKGRDQKTLMKDMRVSETYQWQDQHWKTLLASYSRSPWFEYYRDDLAALYNKPFHFLLDWNLACFEWTLKALAWSVEISFTETYQQFYEDEEWLDGRGKILPKNIMDWTEPVQYRQVFEERTGFIPHLSILDMLFCEGKRTSTLLQDKTR